MVKDFLKKTIMIIRTSATLMETDSFFLTIRNSHHEAHMINADLRMFAFFSMDLKKNPKDHLAIRMLDGKCL